MPIAARLQRLLPQPPKQNTSLNYEEAASLGGLLLLCRSRYQLELHAAPQFAILQSKRSHTRPMDSAGPLGRQLCPADIARQPLATMCNYWMRISSRYGCGWETAAQKRPCRWEIFDRATANRIIGCMGLWPGNKESSSTLPSIAALQQETER